MPRQSLSRCTLSSRRKQLPVKGRLQHGDDKSLCSWITQHVPHSEDLYVRDAMRLIRAVVPTTCHEHHLKNRLDLGLC